MPRTIAQRELRNDNARIFDAVADGADFVVTRNGQPVAELRPVRAKRPSFVTRAQIQSIAGDGTHIDAAAFRADLDGLIDQGVE